METMICRSDAQRRRNFPLPAPDLHQLDGERWGATPDERAALKLLELGKQHFSPRKGSWKRKPDAASRVGRLLFYHRMAMQEELAGQTDRADFFWRESYHELRALWKKNEVWEELSRTLSTEPGVIEMGDPAEMRRRLVDETLIDAHCAFYNGRTRQTESLTPDDRAFAHFGYLTELIEGLNLRGDDLRNVIGPPAELRLKFYSEARDWDRAIETAQLLIKHFPDAVGYQNKLAGLYFSSALDGMDGDSSASRAKHDIDKLLKGVARLQTLRAADPYNLTVYEMLGHLHHALAVKRAIADQLSDALLAAQKAVTFFPASTAFSETRGQLIESMKNLQEQMREVRARIAGQYNARLSAEGLRLQQEAERGFGPMNEYIESADAQETYSNFFIANARRLWQTIGLSVPADDWDDLSLRLLGAINQVFADPPATEAEVGSRWRTLAQPDDRLAALDAVAICAFLQKRLFSPNDQNDQTESEPPAYAQPADPPILTVNSRPGRKRAEPFGYWLFSRQDSGLKATAAGAVVALCLAGALWLRDASYGRVRDNAFQQIIASRERSQYLGVIDGAEAFLAHSPLGGADGREIKVIGYYNEAIARWAAGQNGMDDAVLTSRLNRYRQLMSKYDEGVNRP